MSADNRDKLVRMANQIAAALASQSEAGDEAKGAEAVASHLRRFWTPRMIADFVQRAAETPDALSALAARAVEMLRK